MTATNWVTLIAALFGISGVLTTLWQRQRSEQRDRAHRAEHDARTEWWKRYAWAVETTTRAEPRPEAAGPSTVRALARSPLVTISEMDIVADLVQPPGSGDTGDGRPEGG
ncbi:hypothetical protein GCM10023147_34350 [Tsukamurella soli]|uniref:Uncharacterized protein n=1 Tax=Tsukamurella soli TaxID=644556 RepID=A0ABP8JZW9_9ACTN